LIYNLAPEKKQIFNIYEIVEKVNNTSISLEFSLPDGEKEATKEKEEKKINIKIILACLKILNIF
jgi:hypothetical protein